MGLFRKGETYIISDFHGTDLVTCGQSREGNTLSYSRINTVIIPEGDEDALLVLAPPRAFLGALPPTAEKVK